MKMESESIDLTDDANRIAFQTAMLKQYSNSRSAKAGFIFTYF